MKHSGAVASALTRLVRAATIRTTSAKARANRALPATPARTPIIRRRRARSVRASRATSRIPNVLGTLGPWPARAATPRWRRTMATARKTSRAPRAISRTRSLAASRHPRCAAIATRASTPAPAAILATPNARTATRTCRTIRKRGTPTARAATRINSRRPRSIRHAPRATSLTRVRSKLPAQSAIRSNTRARRRATLPAPPATIPTGRIRVPPSKRAPAATSRSMRRIRTMRSARAAPPATVRTRGRLVAPPPGPLRHQPASPATRTNAKLDSTPRAATPRARPAIRPTTPPPVAIARRAPRVTRLKWITNQARRTAPPATCSARACSEVLGSTVGWTADAPAAGHSWMTSLPPPDETYPVEAAFRGVP